MHNTTKCAITLALISRCTVYISQCQTYVCATKLQSMTHPHDPTCQIMHRESKIDQKHDHGKPSMLLHIRVDISSDSCTLADGAQRISHNTCTVLHCSHLQCDSDRHTSAWCDVTIIMVECVGVDIVS
ncbi:hypothetical protein O5D80_000083 [Batrachochytrium dendrobatidis]|nr:hypothetical protein O5D80_000083 [Batrachochytrium dendrobatidis]